MQKTSKLRKLAGRLLATTCLTAATALAGTVTYTEGVNPASPTDFPNVTNGTPLVAAALPGTTIVNGQVNGTDAADFFELTGLGTGFFTASAVGSANAVVFFSN